MPGVTIFTVPAVVSKCVVMDFSWSTTFHRIDGAQGEQHLIMARTGATGGPWRVRFAERFGAFTRTSV